MTERRMAASSLVRLLGNWYQEGSRIPAYQQLSRSLQLLILDGRLPLNVQLPSERALTSELAVSRTTLAAALSLLREQGFLASRQGSGSVTLLPEGQPSKSQVTSPPPLFDLSTASLSAGPEISHAYAAALEALPEHLSSTGYDSQGLLSLRETIAQRYCQRGLNTEPGQIMVINGAVSGLGLILRLLTGPGDRVVVDHPTYPMAIAAIRGASCRPIPVSLPDQGWDIAGLEATCAQTAPRLAYLIPDFHNPTGRCMDSETREHLAAAIAKSRTTLVVDETMVDLWYDAPPPPPMAAFAGENDVITLGSSGKTFWGGMRLGWIRASKKTIDALIQVRGTLDLGTPLVEQLATIALFNRQHAFMPDRRAMLKARRDACYQLITTLFPQWTTHLPAGGLSWWIELPKPLATLFAVHAESTGIRLASGPHFGIDGAFERYFRLPFTLATPEMQHVLTELQPIWLELMHRGARRLADRIL